MLPPPLICNLPIADAPGAGALKVKAMAWLALGANSPPLFAGTNAGLSHVMVNVEALG